MTFKISCLLVLLAMTRVAFAEDCAIHGRIDHAIMRISKGDFADGASELLDAARLAETGDDEVASLRARFALGLLNALAIGDYKQANEDFKLCARYAPRDLSVMNNLALTELRLHNVPAAVKAWRLAASEEHSEEAIFNIDRIIHLPATSIVPTAAMEEVRELSTEIHSKFSDMSDQRSFKRTGWLYMPLTGISTERDQALIDAFGGLERFEDCRCDFCNGVNGRECPNLRCIKESVGRGIRPADDRLPENSNRCR